jgi:Fic family protein
MDLLPLKQSLETIAVLKQTIKSERALAELKGVLKIIPNKDILLNTLPLQEAKASSEIENIVTTNDALYKSKLDGSMDVNNKEVHSYVRALFEGYTQIKENGFLSNKTIVKMQAILEGNDAGFRTQPGTVLKNNMGETVYSPPQKKEEILDLMRNLEQYINDNNICDLNPLIKMAIIHHRFESIHPFYDGNGRTGRIINVLYLVLNSLLYMPVLYLSRYIIKHKKDYYSLLQSTRDGNNWEPWVIFILKSIEVTAIQTVNIIDDIHKLMDIYKERIKTNHPGVYSHDLIQSLFNHPYSKIEYLEKDLNISRQTASKYLNILAQAGLLKKIKHSKTFYFINVPLLDLLSEVK